jgi:tellurite resistance-related uncharacterized protein
MKHCCQPPGTWVNHKTVWQSIMYLGQPQSTMKHNDHRQGTWVSLKVIESEMEHLGQPQGT